MSAVLPAAALAVVGMVWATSGLQFPIFCFVPIVAFLVSVSGGASVRPTLVARDRACATALVIVVCGFAVGYSAGSAANQQVVTGVAVDRVEKAHFLPLDVQSSEEGVLVAGALRAVSSNGVSTAASGNILVFAEEWDDELWQGAVSARADAGSFRADPSGRLIVHAELGPDPSPLVGMRDEESGGSLAALRHRVSAAIDAGIAGTSGSAAPLVNALVLGDNSRLDPALELFFRRSGTIHLLALSGMHLGVIMALAGALLRPVVGRAGAASVALVLGLLYLVLIGPRAGLVRAYLFALLALVSRLCDRRRPLAEILAISFLVHIAVFPAQVGTLGFLLSYASLAGISICLPAVHRFLSRYLPGPLAGPLAVGIAAQCTTAPFLLATFGAIYPVGSVATAILGPLVLAIMAVGAFAAALLGAGLRSVDSVSVPLLEAGYRLVGRIADFFAGAPAIRGGGAAGGSAATMIAWSSILAAVLATLGLRTLYGRDRVVFTR